MISYSTRAVLLATAFAVSALAATPSAHAASFDGPWSVLVITKSGACDQSYRYGLMIRGSSVSYLGGAEVSVSGRVSPNDRGHDHDEDGTDGVGREECQLDDSVEAGHQHRDHPGPPGPDEERDTCDHLDDAQRQQYPAPRGHLERDSGLMSRACRAPRSMQSGSRAGRSDGAANIGKRETE